MKRFFLLIALVMAVSWIAVSHRSPFGTHAGPPHRGGSYYVHEADSGRMIANETRLQTRRAVAEARQALAEARDEVRQAVVEARNEVHQALGNMRLNAVIDDDSSPALPTIPPSPPVASEDAEGLPVPIVPGTRVTEAEAAPPAVRAVAVAVAPAVPTLSPRRSVTGRISATKERAVADARRELREEIASWLDPEVPRWWTPPTRMLDAMVMGEPRMKSVQKDYGELFEATLTVDMSPQHRASLIDVYDRQLVERRLGTLGATLIFILICLAAVSGYIRADEATKGYYTNRLRMLAAAGVGASGVLIYHMIV